jgi:excisionase family DNA binding protein
VGQTEAPAGAASLAAIRGRVPVVCPSLPPRLVSLTQAAAYLGVSKWTVRDWISAGDLPAVKLPARGDQERLRRVLVDVQDLDRLIEQSKA